MEIDRSDSSEFGAIIARLGGVEALDASARQHRAFRRPRGVKSADDLLRLLLMYGPGGMSLRHVAAAAAAMAIADVSDVALLGRFKGAADWMEALCNQVLQGAVPPVDRSPAPHQDPASHQDPAPYPDPAPREKPLILVDSSRIEGPGGRVSRLHLAWDARQGRITAFALTPTAGGERLDRLPLPPGALCIADRGYPQPDGLRRTREAGADVLVRVTWNSLHLTDPEGRPLDWLSLCEAARQGGAGTGLDRPVQVRKARGAFEPLALRLVMVPKPPDAATEARRAATRASRKDGRRRLDPRTLAGADHLMVLTSLPADAYPPGAVAALYRARWQIELAFKRLKSLLHIDRLPARDPDLARTWLHAHLLVALLAQNLAQDLARDLVTEDAAIATRGAIPP